MMSRKIPVILCNFADRMSKYSEVCKKEAVAVFTAFAVFWHTVCKIYVKYSVNFTIFCILKNRPGLDILLCLSSVNLQKNV